MQGSVWRTLACALVGVSLVGCGAKGAGTAPVKGVVTLKGQPLADAIVSFYPTQGRPASAITDAQGEFALSTFASKDGAMPGHYNVGVTEQVIPPAENDYSPQKTKPLRFAAKYTDPTKSGLTAEVKSGADNNFKFDLTE